MTPDIKELNPIRILTRALKSQKLAHAYMLIGPPGSGKADTLYQMARILLCHNPTIEAGIATPCDTCTGCIKMQGGAHPDLVEIQPDGSFIRIDSIRELQKQVIFPPLIGKRRVCLINRAETLNPSASNALLKILEEPPGDTHLLLSAPNLGSVLPTILSRCQILRQDTRDKGQEGVLTQGVDQDLLPFVQGISGLVPEIEHPLSNGLLKRLITIRDKLVGFISAPDVMDLYQICHSLLPSKQDVILARCILKLIIRDLMLILAHGKTVNHEDKVLPWLTNKDISSHLARLAQGINYDTLLAYDRRLNEAEIMLTRNVKTEMIVERLLIFWLLQPQGGHMLPDHQ